MFFFDTVLGRKLLRAPDCNTLKQISRLNVSGLIWGVDARQLIRTGSFGKYNSEGFACCIMPEPMDENEYHFFFKMVRLKDIERIYENIASSGVLKLYEHMDTLRSIYKGDFHDPNKCGKIKQSGAKTMTMKSPIVLGFYVLGYGLLLTVLVCFAEMIISAMKKLVYRSIKYFHVIFM